MSRSRTFLFATALLLAVTSNSYAASAPLHRTFKVKIGALAPEADMARLEAKNVTRHSGEGNGGR